MGWWFMQTRHRFLAAGVLLLVFSSFLGGRAPDLLWVIPRVVTCRRAHSRWLPADDRFAWAVFFYLGLEGGVGLVLRGWRSSGMAPMRLSFVIK